MRKRYVRRTGTSDVTSSGEPECVLNMAQSQSPTVLDIAQSTPLSVPNIAQSTPLSVLNLAQLEERISEEPILEEHNPPAPEPPEKPVGNDAGAGGGRDESDGALRVVKRYEARGLTVSPSWYAKIRHAIADDGLPAVLDAVDTALAAGNPSWRYVEGILRNRRNERALAAQREAAQRDADALLQERIAREIETKLAILGVNHETA